MIFFLTKIEYPEYYSSIKIFSHNILFNFTAIFVESSKGIQNLKSVQLCFFFLFLGGIASLLSPKVENKIGTPKVFYISMISTFPMMILFMLTYKTLPVISFVIFALMGFITIFATPITMSMAQKFYRNTKVA